MRWLEAVCLGLGCALCVGCEPVVTELAANEPDGAVPSEGAGEPLQGGPFAEPGGDLAAFRALERRLTLGPYCGLTDSEGGEQRYEVEFNPGGTYSTVCLAPNPCEPFGAGTDGEGGLRWQLITLDAAGYGVGKIQSRPLGDALPAGSGSYSMWLSDLRETGAEPLTLYFRLSAVYFFRDREQERPAQSPEWVPVAQNVSVYLRLKGNGPCDPILPGASPAPGAP